MSNSPADDDRLDHDQTDELPILLDTADLGADEDEGRATGETTGEHTSHLLALSPTEHPTPPALESELEQRIEQIASLERDLARLSARWLDTERYLTEKDTVIRDLNRALAKARVETSERRTTEQRLATELQDREAQFNKLLDELDKLRQEYAALERDVEQQRASRHAAVEELALARLELAQHASPINEDDEIRALREELATLSAYIDNRHASWVDTEKRAADRQQRIVELERELAQRAERQQRAEELAERETARALGLREELVAQSRRAESLGAEIEQYRSYPVAQRAAIASLEAELANAWHAHERMQQELSAARSALAKRDAASDPGTGESIAASIARVHASEPTVASGDPVTKTTVGAKGAPALSASTTIGGDSSTIAAHAGSATGRERTEPAGQRETVGEAGRRPGAAPATGEPEHRLAIEARVDVDGARPDAARVEGTTAEKDRALAAQDERNAPPPTEVQRKATTQVLDRPVNPALKRPESKLPPHDRRTDSSTDRANMPQLICLTGDTPRQYPLTKRVTTVGRGAQCDIQILTHFVSREHARLSITQRGNVTIEDLASTNGVFVNSQRVERHELRHGDLVTIGETQFRFLESMAH